MNEEGNGCTCMGVWPWELEFWGEGERGVIGSIGQRAVGCREGDGWLND